MPRKLQNLLVKLLLRLLDVPKVKFEKTQKDKELIEKWLIDSYADQGFQKYFDERNYKIVRELANGAGLAEMPRDAYIRYIGQRFELLLLYTKSKEAFLIKSRQERKKREVEVETPAP